MFCVFFGSFDCILEPLFDASTLPLVVPTLTNLEANIALINPHLLYP